MSRRGRRASIERLKLPDRVVDGIEVRFWTPERIPDAPFEGLNVLDLRAIKPDLAAIRPGADLILTESDAAAAAWQMLAPTPLVAVIPPIAIGASPQTAFCTLHILAGVSPNGETVRLAMRASAWAAAHGIGCGLVDPVGAAGLALVARIGKTSSVDGAALLDLRAGTDLLASPLPLIAALANGMPILFSEFSTWRDTLHRAGAAVCLATLEAGLDQFAALTEFARAALATAALGYVETHHGAARARAALETAITTGLRRRHDAAWDAPTGMHVLVVSDEALNLLYIRVHLPFAALRARGVIAGYAVLRQGEFVFGDTAGVRFGAIWVQRSLDPLVQLMLQVIDRPYVYDLDDLLLVTPSYRAPFPAQSAETVRGLIEGARVFSCATSPLATLAERHGAQGAIGHAVVTRNLVGTVDRPVAGAAKTVVWASSDTPALDRSRREIERAVRDFCLAHDLPILCVGAPPPAAFHAAGLAVEHVGLLSYAAYLARLRDAAPGILLAPLETSADAATQDFIDAKSDIKMIEALQAGLVGVFSRAVPYLDSTLPPPILCENSYESWLDGLERARHRCLQPSDPAAVPVDRALDRDGLRPWAAALRRARTDLSADDVIAAVRYVRRQSETLLSAPERFDEADYLRRHDDVRRAVTDGIVESGYRHFVQSGFREGREARRLPDAEAAAEFWWSRLLHKVGRLEAAAAARQRTMTGLGARLTLHRKTPTEKPTLAAWVPEGNVPGACPVCDAAGPHRQVLVAMEQILGRCSKCGSCFYADRVAYDYEDPDAAEMLLRFNLEQNAGIHQQTRPLFAIPDARSVLDIGCGFGFAVDMARTLGWRAVGLDPSFYAEAGALLLGADIRQGYLAAQSDLGTPFDLVLASEVLEHLAAPYEFLGLLRTQLAEGGTLVLSTPNAAAIAPENGDARLLAILAPRVHLVLFTRESLTLALQRAGFRHVQVSDSGDGLVAYASDRPLRLASDAEHRHHRAYPAYLQGLLDRATPGSPLWNGAAGRLLFWLAPIAEPEAVQALLDRIDANWRPRFGIDLAMGGVGNHAETPFNLGTVLLAGAVLAERLGEDVLPLARAAYRVAVTTGRALQAANMVDHDLRQTARSARIMVVNALAHAAPELEAELVQGLLAPSPGGLAEWVDPTPEMLLPRLALAFAAAVGDDRFDDARRLAPALGDTDALCRHLADHDEALLRVLFTLGIFRLNAEHDPAAALALFKRMALEARARRVRGPAMHDHLHLAERHIGLVSDRFS